MLAAGTKDRLARLQYDFEKLKKIMLREELTTLQLVWRESSNITILQDEVMGRPSHIRVGIPVSGGIVVSGGAVWI